MIKAFNRKSWKRGSAFAASIAVATGAASQPSPVDRADKPSWRDFVGYQATVDLQTTGVYSEGQNRLGGEFTAGLDGYAKFSSRARDVATAVIQIYGSRVENHPRPPGFYEGMSDWEFSPRINTINFHLTHDRRFSFKLGHFEIPFGLEQTINTGGTLRRFDNSQNLGAKLDWGATLNGTFPRFQYEFSLSRGSGMEFRSANDPYAIAGRVGTPIDSESFWGANSWGVSIYHAEILRGNGLTERRWRVGVDGQRYMGPIGVLGELSAGETAGRETLNSFLEINVTNPRETVLAYSQLRWSSLRAASGWDDLGSGAIGVRYAPDNHWALSGQFTQEFWQRGARPADQLFLLQLRYRF